VSFVLMIAGVAVASAPDMANSTSEDSSQIAWTIIFFISVPLASLYNVWQAQYMEEMTIKPVKAHDEADIDHHADEEARTCDNGSMRAHDNERASAVAARASKGGAGVGYGSLQNEEGGAVANQSAEDDADLLTPDGVKRGEDMIVKLVMLFGDTGLQFVMTMCLLPSDAIPWFGQSSSVADAGESFINGVACIFTCDMNGVYCILYSAGFVFTYIGSAYLNHYSATLCSMIGQLSSPVTALLLIFVPQWNLEPSDSAWYWSVIAIFLLSVGTVIYFAWEEMTAPTEDGSVVTLLGADGLPRQRLPASKEEADAVHNHTATTATQQ
jgi:hypothetical protein